MSQFVGKYLYETLSLQEPSLEQLLPISSFRVTVNLHRHRSGNPHLGDHLLPLRLRQVVVALHRAHLNSS